ncbi:Trk system potassium uptake protein TrkA [Treponema primitia ZAS-2]|uniref:Trk system potassium uptake protein TrkA n=1 Tax=Treponema primitia (strain ATCC BAA-887 / DSM 12427 / ZAS-2) TaxID=545694 RepID=F5YKX4_TREPZ|nr:Trk system potassium transport protein TrkA [Treponema primitia]AEF84620.1 Trk system potassium uptake protein TrkA [Treponema primitia ZAS-2]
MRIVIVGGGMVGTLLARHLIHEKHDVSLIEANEERARHASNRLDCLVIHDGGNSISALEEAGIAKADALVCVTDSDEVNMITCGLAASRYPELLKIARVRNDDYIKLNAGENRFLENRAILGIDYFVHPDVEAARSAISSIEHGAMGDILVFADTPYELGAVDINEGSKFDGLVMKDFRTLVKEDSLVTLVERREETLLPRGSTVLAPGDRLHILAKEQDLDRIFKLAGRSERVLRKIGIVGGSRVGALIAEGLLGMDKPGENRHAKSIFSRLKPFISRSGRRVTIIEKDYNLCKDLSARYPEALVLNEDISDESFVSEERIDDLDLIVTATEDQELNMIAAIYLKSRGVHRAIAMVTGSGYAAIARQLGVDVVIPMKSVVVDSILSHLMGEGITRVHRLGDGSINVVELELGPDTPAADKGIAELDLPGGGLVMLVNRGDRSFIPRGDYIFKSGDRIILIAKNGSEAEIERFFGSFQDRS